MTTQTSEISDGVALTTGNLFSSWIVNFGVQASCYQSGRLGIVYSLCLAFMRIHGKANFLLTAIAVLTPLTLIGCSTLTVNEYEATALTTYTWQVKYAIDLVQVTIKKVRKLSCDRKVYLGRKIGIWNFALCDSFQG